jgi:hypothetical protein
MCLVRTAAKKLSSPPTGSAFCTDAKVGAARGKLSAYTCVLLTVPADWPQDDASTRIVEAQFARVIRSCGSTGEAFHGCTRTCASDCDCTTHMPLCFEHASSSRDKSTDRLCL